MFVENVIDKRAPMASAPMKYKQDGSVDWGNMWDTFCVLAQEGGPPHRGMMLYGPSKPPDVTHPNYRFAVAEIIRGIAQVSGLEAHPATPGWIAITCPTWEMAHWLKDAVMEENVEARAKGYQLLVPVDDNYSLKGEIKNVITAVAKTTHYWEAHLPVEVKQTLAIQAQFAQWLEPIKKWLRLS